MISGDRKWILDEYSCYIAHVDYIDAILFFSSALFDCGEDSGGGHILLHRKQWYIFQSRD